MAAAFPFVAPAQGPGVLQPFPNPSMYLGVFSGTNPSASVNGQWWYRVDLNAIFEYLNGQAVPISTGGPARIIAGSETLGGANVTVDSDIIVLPSSTLVTYGSVFFGRRLLVLGGGAWISSNPNASSTSPQENTYNIYGGLYLDGQYIVGQYNADTIVTPTISNILYSGTINVSGALSVSSNATLSNVNIVGSGTLSVAAGYTLSLYTNLSVSTLTLAGGGAIFVAAGYTLSLSGATVGIYSISGSGTLALSGTITIPPSATSVWSFANNPYAPQPGAYIAQPGLTIDTEGVLVVYTPRSYGSGSDAFSFTYPPVFGSVNPSVTGAGMAIFGAFYDTIAGHPSVVGFTSQTLAPGANSSASAPGASITGGLGLQITSLSVLSAGTYVLELYTSSTWYNFIAQVYAGSATASFSNEANPILIGVDGTGSCPVGYYTYVRNGANSSGTIVVSGLIYGG